MPCVRFYFDHKKLFIFHVEVSHWTHRTLSNYALDARVCQLHTLNEINPCRYKGRLLVVIPSGFVSY